MAKDAQIKNDILQILSVAPKQGYQTKEILDIMCHLDQKRFQRLLRELLNSNKIIKTPHGLWKLTAVNTEISGRISINPQGFGFVIQDTPDPENKQDIFIPPYAVGTAISGDSVQVAITDSDNPRGPSGEITKITKRAHKEIVGALAETKDGWAIRPLRRELPSLIPLIQDKDKNNDALQKSKPGDWVLADLITGDSSYDLRAKLTKRLAGSGKVKADLDAIVKEFDLPKQYTQTMEKRAAAITPLKVPREDLTNLTIFTMDPVDARDYDDALSYQETSNNNECIIGVHIADVSCYVQHNNFLDKAAVKRGFTSYLPGRTIPMLPRKLANTLCSLQAGVPRLAHTVFVRIDKRNGQILNWRRCHSTINVQKRLCYEDAADLFAGRPSNLSDDIKELLQKLLKLSQTMRKYRQEVELFIPMEMPEIRIICTEKPSQIIGLQENEPNTAHELVEEFMLAANQCVSLELQHSRIPALFRNHPDPDPDALSEFTVQAEQLLGQRIHKLKTRRDLVRFLQQVNKTPLRNVVNLTLLRHFPRAFYGPTNEGHFGLGKINYCHFTSPIRRYPDLIVHQQLIAKDLHQKFISSEKMLLLAQTCTAQEENCDQASFAASDRMKLRYMLIQQEKDPSMQLQGNIIKASKMGVMIFIMPYSLMGAVSYKDFPNGSWYFEGKNQRWVDRNTQRILQIRDAISCRILSADPIRGELSLTLSETPTPSQNKKQKFRNKKSRR